MEKKGSGLSFCIPIRASEAAAVVLAAAEPAICFVGLAGDGDANAWATAPLPLRARPPRASPWSMSGLLSDALLLLLLLLLLLFLALGEEAAAPGGERIVCFDAEKEKNLLLKSEKNEKRSNQKKNTLTALLGREALRQPVQEPLQLDSRGVVLVGRVGLYPGRERILLGLWGVGVRSLLFYGFLFLLLELDTEPAVEPAARHHRRQGSRDSCQGM